MTRDIAKLKKLNNDRYDYSKNSGELPLPELVTIQTKSYEEFKNNKDLQKQFKYILYNDYTENTKNKLLEIIRKELVYA